MYPSGSISATGYVQAGGVSATNGYFSGGVGIGTTAPAVPFQVSGVMASAMTGSGNPELKLYNTTNGGYTVFGQNGYFRVGLTDTSGNWQKNVLSITSNSTVYATAFIGDGSGLTNLPASSGNSITSGTTKVTANSTGYISLTTSGVTTGYFNTAGGLVVPTVSTTDISGGIKANNGLFLNNLVVGANWSPSATIDVAGGIHIGGWLRGGGGLANATFPAQGGYIGWNEDNGGGRTSFMNNRGSGGGGFDFSLYDGSGNFISTPVTIGNTGFVGIGTTNPSYTLDVFGLASGAGNQVVQFKADASAVPLRIYSDSTGSGITNGWNAGNANELIYLDSSHNMRFWTSGYERMRIASNSYVGIATTAPTYPLDVSGSIRASGEVISTNLNQFRMIWDNYGAFWRNDGANLYLLLTNSGDQYGGYNSLRPFYVNLATGGVKMDNSLNVQGGLYSTSGSANANVSINYTGSSGRMYSLISCQSCNTVGAGGFEIYDNTANVGRAYISPGTNGWQTPSDRRLKENIQTLSVLAKIDELRGVSYNLKESGKPQIGVIAQEVQKAFPTAVTGKESAKTYLGVSYDAIAAIALQGVKELKALVDTNTADIAALKAENDTLKAQLKATNDNDARLTREIEALRAAVNGKR